MRMNPGMPNLDHSDFDVTNFIALIYSWILWAYTAWRVLFWIFNYGTNLWQQKKKKKNTDCWYTKNKKKVLKITSQRYIKILLEF